MAGSAGAAATRRSALVAAGAGVVVGAVTLVLRHLLAAPWDLLGDSFGVWCLVPFLLGRGARELRAAALRGAAASTGMNAGYYGALALLTGRVGGAGVVVFWVLAAAAVGAVMAVAARLSRRSGAPSSGPSGAPSSGPSGAPSSGPSGARWAALACLPGAVFVLEALPVSGLHVLDGADGQLLQRSWVAAGVLITAALATRSPGGPLPPTNPPGASVAPGPPHAPGLASAPGAPAGAPPPRHGRGGAGPLVAVAVLPLAVVVSGGWWWTARQLLTLLAAP